MALQHFQNYSLKAFNSFGVDGRARDFWRLDDVNLLPTLMQALKQSPHAPPLILGEGSNLLLTKPLEQPVVKFDFERVSVLQENDQEVIIQAEAGASWHPFVQYCLGQAWYGLENLSLIPGTVGAAPVQNIGAYGVELKDSIAGVSAWNTQTGQFVQLEAENCAFGYRDSIFKTKSELWITAVQFRLSKHADLRLDYGDIRAWLSEHGRSSPSPQDVSDAVVAIRSSKLPNPKVLGNAGSFFKNPMVSLNQAQNLLAQYPKMPQYPGASPGQRKLSAAWLIDQAGFKGHRRGDVGVHQSHALVLVNYGKASGVQILQLAQEIQAKIRQDYGVSLATEPTII